MRLTGRDKAQGGNLGETGVHRGTVLIAGAANIFVGAIKLAAGIMVGASASADRAEDAADDVDRRLADRLPLVPHVFLDPTQTPAG